MLTHPPERPSVPGPLLWPRSAYLAQARQIAPPTLVGREAELAELARFCPDERGPYPRILDTGFMRLVPS